MGREGDEGGWLDCDNGGSESPTPTRWRLELRSSDSRKSRKPRCENRVKAVASWRAMALPNGVAGSRAESRESRPSIVPGTCSSCCVAGAVWETLG